MKRWTPLVLVLGACSPLGPWLWSRYSDPSGDPWGLIALGIAAILVIRLKRKEGAPWQASSAWLAVGGACLVVYTFSWGKIPTLMVCGPAMLAVGSAIFYALNTQSRSQAWGLMPLLLLSLPLGPSLDFYVGYPLRYLTTLVTSAVLTGAGIKAESMGAGLSLGDQTFFVDPACAGIRMLWTSLVFLTSLAATRGLNIVRIGSLWVWVLALVLMANIWRGACLVWIEGVLRWNPPGWLHGWIGLVAFGMVLWAGERAARMRLSN